MPKFSAQFVLRVLESLDTRLSANLNSYVRALGTNLPEVVSFDTPMEETTIFPAVYLEPVEARLAQSDDDKQIDQQLEFAVHVAMTDIDFRQTRKKICQYVLAIDQCLRDMKAADFLSGGVTATVTEPVWEVTRHRYSGVLENDRNLYRRDAELTLIIEIKEL